MAKSILQQLFDGEIYPSQNTNPDSPEYNGTKRSLVEGKEYFLKTLPEHDRDRFKKLDDLYFDMSDIYGYESFVYGFRLGVRLMTETLDTTVDITLKSNE